jgi:quinol monooxygenase YgiN
MAIYQMKIEIKPYKSDEFNSNLRSLLPRIRQQAGCLNFGVYRDSEKRDVYYLVGEWKTRNNMDKHFGTNDFRILIGSARVLGKTFSFDIAEKTRRGSYELAKEKIDSHKICKGKTD